MAAIENLFGIEIILQDHASPVSADAAIGLYVLTSLIDAVVAGGGVQKTVTVVDGSGFRAGEKVSLVKVGVNETAVIESIAGNVLTMFDFITNSFTPGVGVKVNGNSVFRWITYQSATVTGWQHGIIEEGGIVAPVREADIKQAGSVALPGGGEVSVKNTNEFHKSLLDRLIYLNGLQINVVEFIDGAKTAYWTGKCEWPSWTAKSFRIPFKGAVNGRAANIGIVNEDGQDVPITFGKLADPSLPAKAIRTKKTERVLNLNEWPWDAAAPTSATSFHVTANTGTSITVSLADALLGLTTAEMNTILAGKYIKITEGTNNAGLYRKIGSITSVVNSNPGTMTFQISNFLPSALDTTNFLQFLDIELSYSVDSWKGKGIVDENGNVLTGQFQVFAYDESQKKYSALSISNSSLSIDKNILTVQNDFTEGKITEAETYTILPIRSPTPLQNASLMNSWLGAGTFIHVIDGVFYDSTADMTGAGGQDAAIGNLNNLMDKTVANTCILNGGKFVVNGISGVRAFVALVFELPVLPENFTDDFETYLMIMAEGAQSFESGNNATQIKQGYEIRGRRVASYFTALKNNYNFGAGAGATKYLRTLLDEYVTDAVNNNVYFFQEKEDALEISGIKKISLSVSNKEKYNAIQEVLYLHKLETVEAVFTVARLILTIKEMAVAIKVSRSIENEVFLLYHGRIFNDTWGGRETSVDVIESPIDVFEHVCRLQNWTESSPLPKDGAGNVLAWGQGYAKAPRIKISGAGSFDDASLAGVDGLKMAFQILDHGEAWTDKIKENICRMLQLGSYIDENGKECLVSLEKPQSAAATTITLANISDRDSIEIEEPDPSEIYPEPFVLYEKDYSTGEYKKSIRITRSDAESWNAAYVEGWDGADAQEYWERCQTLWKRSREIQEPSSDLTELPFCGGVDAKTMAIRYLKGWIDWQYNPTIRFKIHWSYIRTWREFELFNLQLPHQTSNLIAKCRALRIAPDFNEPGNCEIEAILYKDAIPAEYEYQDVMAAFGGAGDWQDHMSTYVERGSTGLTDKADES